MRYVSGLEKVEVGDYVMTTGQDGIYPPGLNVGEVVDVKNGTATQPPSNFDQAGCPTGPNWKRVAVLLYHAPSEPLPEQTLPNVDKPKK